MNGKLRGLFRRQHTHEPITVDQIKFEALKTLIGEDKLMRYCDVQSVSVTQRRISFTRNNHEVQDILQRIQGILQDELSVDEADHVKVEAATQDALVDNVYIKYLKTQNKIVIFASEWELLHRTKRRIQKHFGQYRNSHGLMRFREPDVAFPEVQGFTMRGKLLTIKTYKAALDSLPVDVIVNPTNETLMQGNDPCPEDAVHGRNLFEIFKKKSPIPVTDMTVTCRGDDRGTLVIYCHGLSSTTAATKYLENLHSTILRCLCEVWNRSCTSIAIPVITSAVMVTSARQCAETYVRAVKSFDENVIGGSLREVHFVDSSDTTVRLFENELKSGWSMFPTEKILERDKQVISAYLKT
ncbi:uncharacterized protein [Haliotis cracherodii]|uniref:uncharacterized protein n=1 Tax=Haliotis cracherodii TaxID=6455 RepID=UPI0039E7855B